MLFIPHFLLKERLGRERRGESTCCPQLICTFQGYAPFHGLFLVPLFKKKKSSFSEGNTLQKKIHSLLIKSRTFLKVTPPQAVREAAQELPPITRRKITKSAHS